MFSGLRSVVYHVADLERAKAWWAGLLGFAPYFDQPFYVGFQVGGYELGLHPEDGVAGHPNAPGSVITYWGVEDVDAAYARIIALGAVEHQVIQDVGEGIRLAAVVDPFGNIVGLINNPHFKLPGAS
jgi:catechol 2,3-dioxygenase-like lactoylglutathione lyase family enzyme